MNSFGVRVRKVTQLALIVKHLRGNMLSRWTDFLTSDGEKLWRNREDEFEMDLRDKEHLISLGKKAGNAFLKRSTL